MRRPRRSSGKAGRVGTASEQNPPRACAAELRAPQARCSGAKAECDMGRYLLLWLLGVPIPILIIIWALGGLH
jgi:hypothetical protein